jgi:membrane-associated phospholipid phosphatase
MGLSSAVTLLALLYLTIHVGLVVKSRFPAFKLIKLLTVDLGLICFFGLLASEPEWFSRTVPGGRIIFLWSPIVFFWSAYLWAGHTLTAFHETGFSYDHKILAWEKKWLGQPSLWLARNRKRWLTEAMQFFYFSYFFYTLFLGLFLHIQNRIAEFQAMSFAVLFGYLVSYTFFAITPAEGPRWALVSHGLLPATEQRQIGYELTRFVERIMYGVAHKGGAMPSAHSSTAVIFLVWCWRIWGVEGGSAALIIVVGMWIGAVYGRYHYVLDILAGGTLGIVSVLVADAVFHGI